MVDENEERTWTCPSGHKLPLKDFHTYVDLKIQDIDAAVVFYCPGGKRGHNFSLRKAVACGIFTIEEAAKIRAGGLEHRRKYGQATKA